MECSLDGHVCAARQSGEHQALPGAPARPPPPASPPLFIVLRPRVQEPPSESVFTVFSVASASRKRSIERASGLVFCAGVQKINHFPGMSEICRKDLLARNLNRMFKQQPKVPTYPLSHISIALLLLSSHVYEYLASTSTALMNRKLFAFVHRSVVRIMYNTLQNINRLMFVLQDYSFFPHSWVMPAEYALLHLFHSLFIPFLFLLNSLVLEQLRGEVPMSKGINVDVRLY